MGPGNVREYPTVALSPAAFRSVDRVALSNVTLAAIMGLAGVVLSLLALLDTPAFSLIGVTTVGSGTSLSVNTSGLYLLGAVGGGGIAFTLLELWFYRRAFRTLARQDRRFSTPTTLVWLAMVAVVIIVAAVVALLVVLYDAILCAGAGYVLTSRCLNVGELLALAGIVAIAAIVLLAGYIGLLIGIWRLGTRYGEWMFKVGAIFMIIPFLNVAGTIFILIAARESSGKTPRAFSPPKFG
ncbi:MAG: DUF973 family protein [Thermoplasmata archaeon]